MPENYVQSLVLRIRKNKKRIKLYNRFEAILLICTHIAWTISMGVIVFNSSDVSIDIINRAIAISICGFLGVALVSHIVFCILRGLKIQENIDLRQKKRNA